MLAAAEWDVALLQECAAALRRAAGRGLRRRGAPGADLAQPARLRCAAAAARLNPDLIASGEGGSNLTLVRAVRPARRRSSSGASWRSTRAGRSAARWPSPAPPPASASPTCTRPTTSRSWPPRTCCSPPAPRPSGPAGAPLLFGGDLNLRPAESPGDLRGSCASASAWRAPTAPRRDRPPAGPRHGGAPTAHPLAARAAGGSPGRARPAPLRPHPRRSAVCNRR